MTLKEAIFEIEKRIPLEQAEDFDNVGLLCGNFKTDVTGMLICHDALESVIDEAISTQSNLIITFHPIIFSDLKSLTGKNYVERSIIKALENKIAIYAVHTAFDNHFFGVNFGICEKLGLINQQILQPKQSNLRNLEVIVPQENAEELRTALYAAGAGNIGFYDECSFSVSGQGTFRPIEGSKPYSGQQNIQENCDEQMISVLFESYKQRQIIAAMKNSHPYEEVAHKIVQLENENQYVGLGRFGDLKEEMEEEDFLQFVKDTFNLKVIRHSKFLGKKIKKVGVLGGSGASAIKDARIKRCDAYLTGDIKYHDFFQDEDQMLICDIGHFESEQFVCEQLYNLLSEIFPKFAVSKSVEKTNPVNYFL